MPVLYEQNVNSARKAFTGMENSFRGGCTALARYAILINNYETALPPAGIYRFPVYRPMKGHSTIMKYIDRYQIGMEYYMAQLSELTSPLNPLSPQDTVTHLQEFSFSVQSDACKTIQMGLRRLVSSRYSLNTIVPARIRVIAESQFTPTAERLLPVFKWVETLRQENERACRQWLYALKDVSCRIAPEADSFLQAFSQLRAQRVTLSLQPGAAMLSIPESLWGQARMIFDAPQIDPLPDESGEASITGYLFWVEADRTDSGLEFRFLIDTEFSDTVYTERLLQKQNWQEIRLCCSEARMHVTRFDYAGRLHRRGCSGMAALAACFTELLKKQTMLGSAALSMEENRLLGCAQLFAKSQLLPAVPPPARLTRADILFENRYLVERTASFFEQECGELGKELHKLLTDAQDKYDDEQPERSEKLMQRFCETLRQSEFDGSARQVTRPLLKRFAAASAEYDDKPYFAAAYDTACKAAKKQAEEFLNKHHFTGEFPHYYRLRGGKAEYLTLRISDKPSLMTDGRLCFVCEVAAAKRRFFRVNETEMVLGLPAAEGCAAEFEFDDCFGTHYGVVDFDQNGKSCLFSWPFDGELTEESAQETAVRLLSMLEIAERGLRGKKLPRAYAARHKRQIAAEHLFSHYLGHSLVFGVLLAIVGLLITKNLVQSRIQAAAVVFACLTGSLLIVVLISAIRYLIVRRSIWRR